jgi:hypothetical protein
MENQQKMEIGKVYRYSRPYDSDPEKKDGLPNYFHYTCTPGLNKALLEAGINRIQEVKTKDGVRRPAILISSSPHKIGSQETPWQDFFDPDNGYIKYYGDNKEPGDDPTESLGNKILLEQFELHRSPDRNRRLKACPTVFFKRVQHGLRIKGNVKFQGFGIINRAERVTQFDQKNDCAFTNYVFEFVVFDLKSEKELFDWNWISFRRDKNLDDEQSLEYAPASWKKWVNGGSKVIETCRRRVVKLLTVKTLEQRPIEGSRESKVLDEIYKFYSDKRRNDRFESLASFVVARVIQSNGHSYREGWITPESSDHGVDFIGRLDIGTDLAKAKIIVLGQAKCEKLDSPTNGYHIARTVARLKRGYIGAYVTTSYFSEPVQREVLEDKFPVILINGLRLAKEVLSIVNEGGYADVRELLTTIDSQHDSKIQQKDPDEILFEE